MSKFIPNSKRYKYPLPIHPIDTLPRIVPHNPISWLRWLYKYLNSTNSLHSKIQVTFLNGNHITIQDPQEMLYLWENGFFGSAQLSRSEPTWKRRTLTRLGMDEENSKAALEEVTNLRRKQRLEFKKERSRFEGIKLELRKQGVLDDEILDREREFLKTLRDKELELSKNEGIDFRVEDSELLLESGEDIVELEVLELMPVEAIFLTFALKVLDIGVHELFSQLVGSVVEYRQIHQLVTQYVAYHHYRSHGWCVRSGIKFGCEYLLYKRGPPFQHAEFGVMVMDHDASNDYTWYSSIARVVGGAKKCFVICFVERINTEDEVLALWKEGKYEQVFGSYKIGEIVYKRWIPGKNRD